MSPCTILRALQSVNPTRYWALALVSDSGIDVLDELAPGVASDELGGVDGAGATTGGVFAGFDEVPDGAAGLIDDEDVGGEGATTGGVFVVEVLGVDDSRLQPETASTRPAQTRVAIALFICDLHGVDIRGSSPPTFSRFDADRAARCTCARVAKCPVESVLSSFGYTARRACDDRPPPTPLAQFSSAAGNNYPIAAIDADAARRTPLARSCRRTDLGERYAPCGCPRVPRNDPDEIPGAPSVDAGPTDTASLAALAAEVSGLREELRSLGRYGRLVGAAPAMQRLYDEVSRVASSHAAALITGESGVGKERVARTIHELGRRRLRPFVAVHCGAISPRIGETELAGREAGAREAGRWPRGYFERAQGGTLFLDEITEMPVDLQAPLLRAIEAQEGNRPAIGASFGDDVRVLAASTRDPRDAVAAGKLRHDLLLRLQAQTIAVPPLRERGEDIELLALHFVADLNRRSGTHKAFTPVALDRLKRHHWPGNVRELANAVHRAFVMTDGNWITQAGLSPEPLLGAESGTSSFEVGVGDRIDAVEKRLILATVQHTHTKEAAAEILGISVKTLYNRLRAYESCTQPRDVAASASPARAASVPEPDPRTRPT